MNYHKYVLSLWEYLLYGLIYIVVNGIISYLFFMSIIPFICFMPGLYLFYKYLGNALKARRDKILTVQFKEYISIISSLLSTGYSLENSILESIKELHSLYPESYMEKEAKIMAGKIMLHSPPDLLFKDLAERTDIDHIKNFSEILSIASKSGGNLIDIILSTTSSIRMQINIQREIDTALAGKKYEFLIMSIMPIIIMFYIKFSQPGFFDSVYGNLLGVLIMFICLCVYMFAIYLSYKILSKIQ